VATPSAVPHRFQFDSALDRTPHDSRCGQHSFGFGPDTNRMEGVSRPMFPTRRLKLTAIEVQ
jgi:hypothetical protein